MTVCIAATCDGGQGVIIAADRMLSTPLIQFEHRSTKKITQLSHRCHALTAGDALAHTELFNIVENKIAHMKEPSVEHILETIKETYQGLRRKKIVEQYLLPRAFPGIDEFYQRQRHLAENVAYSIQNEIDKFDFGLQILVGGLSHRRAHIYTVTNPGVSQCFDSINFHAIGSGHFHAFSSLISSGCHQMLTLPETLMAVLGAKRVSEVAPGVGSLTDISMIGPFGTIEIPSETVRELIPANDLWKQGNQSWRQGCNDFLNRLVTQPHPKPPDPPATKAGEASSGEIADDGESPGQTASNGSGAAGGESPATESNGDKDSPDKQRSGESS